MDRGQRCIHCMARGVESVKTFKSIYVRRSTHVNGAVGIQAKIGIERVRRSASTNVQYGHVDGRTMAQQLAARRVGRFPY